MATTPTVTFRSLFAEVGTPSPLDLFADMGATFLSVNHYGNLVDPGPIVETRDHVSDGPGNLSKPNANGANVLLPPYCGQGDYHGDATHASNREVLRELVEGDDGNGIAPLPHVTFSSHYGFEAVGLILDAPIIGDDAVDAAREVVERLAGLVNYPVLDEGHQSETECELIAAEWSEDGTGAQDFAGALEDRIGCGRGTAGDGVFEIPYDTEAERSRLWELHSHVSERANINGGTGYMIETGATVCLFLDDVAAAIHPAAIFALELVRTDTDGGLRLSQEAATDADARDEVRRIDRLSRIGHAMRRRVLGTSSPTLDNILSQDVQAGDCDAPLGPDSIRNAALRSITIDGETVDPYAS